MVDKLPQESLSSTDYPTDRTAESGVDSGSELHVWTDGSRVYLPLNLFIKCINTIYNHSPSGCCLRPCTQPAQEQLQMMELWLWIISPLPKKPIFVFSVFLLIVLKAARHDIAHGIKDSSSRWQKLKSMRFQPVLAASRRKQSWPRLPFSGKKWLCWKVL